MLLRTFDITVFLFLLQLPADITYQLSTSIEENKEDRSWPTAGRRGARNEKEKNKNSGCIGAGKWLGGAPT